MIGKSDYPNTLVLLPIIYGSIGGQGMGQKNKWKESGEGQDERPSRWNYCRNRIIPLISCQLCDARVLTWASPGVVHSIFLARQQRMPKLTVAQTPLVKLNMINQMKQYTHIYKLYIAMLWPTRHGFVHIHTLDYPNGQ